MPLERHLLPIPLPTGRTGDVGHLSVFFDLRLLGTGQIGRPDYPELDDWPATLADRLDLDVELDGQPVPEVRRVSTDPSSTVWAAVFAHDTPVRGRRFLHWAGADVVQPLPTSDFSEAILDLYVALAGSHPEDPPSGDELVGLPQSALLLGSDDGRAGLAEARAWSEPMEQAMAADPDDELTEPTWDFHQYVALLGHHPALLRQLGLVLDLEIDLPPGVDPGEVVVRTGFFDGANLAREVPVATQLGPGFQPLTNPDPTMSDEIGGYLDLSASSAGSGQPAYLSIVDPLQAARRLERVEAQMAEADRGLGDLPALSTRALSLVRPDLVATWRNRTIRQAQLEEEIFDSANLQPPQRTPVAVYAEDLRRGLRVDVWREKRWNSLFERLAATGYEFPRDGTLEIDPGPDEGWTTTLLATEEREQLVPSNLGENTKVDIPTASRRLDDAVYRWRGWSGAVPPPGNALDGTGVAEPDANLPREDEPVQFAVTYEARGGSLPRLRFGQDYRMRVRTVDLAGHSAPIEAEEPEVARTELERFGRLEPIGAPILVRHTERPDPGVGDLTTTLVIRSELEADAADAPPTARLLFPTQVGQDLCELHGEPKGGVDPASYEVLVARGAVSLADQVETDARTGELLAVGEAHQPVEYLSDPAASGVRVSLPALRHEPLLDLRGDWPERDSLRIELVGGDNDVVTEPDEATDLRVHLAKAEIVPGTLSFAPMAERIDHFALWQRQTPAWQDENRDLVEGGGHWMLSARKRVTLVHAVRLPLMEPLTLGLSVARNRGRRDAVLDGSLGVDRKSTSKVEMTATWTDPVDDLRQPGPVDRTTTAPLGPVEVTRSSSQEQEFDGHRCVLPDTRHHRAEVSLEAFSSFSRYFTERLETVVDGRVISLWPEGVAPSTVEVTVAGGKRRPEAGVDYRVDGTRGALWVVPTSSVISLGDRLEVQFVPLPVSRLGSTTFPLDIPNTVAPPTPTVHRTLVAFARSLDKSAEGTAIEHRGTVVRVYLDRPWYRSGPGEMVGVVIGDDTDPGGTTWLARDPIALDTSVGARPPASAFPRGVGTLTTADGRQIVLHDVVYAEDEGRWFVDIEIDTDRHRPFVRLALVRAQPASVEGAEASTTVELAPVRLGVRRKVAVAVAGDTAAVEIAGPLHDGVPDEAGDGTVRTNRMRVTVQTLADGGGDRALRWANTKTAMELDPVDAGDGSGDTQWTGEIEVGGEGERRLLIEELAPTVRREGRGVIDADDVVYVETVDLDG